jgi:hypothetical protein
MLKINNVTEYAVAKGAKFTTTPARSSPTSLST